MCELAGLEGVKSELSEMLTVGLVTRVRFTFLFLRRFSFLRGGWSNPCPSKR